MSEKPCAACGAWWLPGSEKCPAHAIDEGFSLDDPNLKNLSNYKGAPRVYPREMSIEKVYARLVNAASRCR
jgi:hypothetical protein